MKLKFAHVAVALLTLGLSSGVAFADSLGISLDSTTATIHQQAGGTASYTVELAGPASGTLFLNGDAFNVATPIALDDSGFFATPVSMSSGDTYSGILFTLTAAPGTPLGVYSGYFTITGGTDDMTYQDIGTVNYTVTVTPEPSSFMLLGTGMASAFAAYKRRRAV